MKPISIVGGGLAGLALAIGLRRHGVEVVVLEAGRYPRHRVCGEFINGLRPEVLPRLGLPKLFADVQARPLTETRWFSKRDASPLLRANLSSPAQAISRHRLDAWLKARLEQLGGKLREGVTWKERDFLQAPPGVVRATGRRLQRDSRWIGLKVHALHLPPAEPGFQGLEMHLGEGGYIGVTPVENGRFNICGLFARRAASSSKTTPSHPPRPKREALLEWYGEQCALAPLADRLRQAEIDAESFVAVSGLPLGTFDTPGDSQPDATLRLGDAERMIPPFTGHGMAMAFESAAAVLPSLVDFARGGASWSQARESAGNELHRRFDRRSILADLFHPVVHSPRFSPALAWAAQHGLVPFSLLHRAFR